MKRIFLCALIAVGFTGGCTIAPKPVTSNVVVFSGNTQNAGILGRTPDGGWHIADATRLRYVALIDAGYGKTFTPPLKDSDGLTKLPDGTWELDSEHMVDFGVMATLKRSGVHP